MELHRWWLYTDTEPLALPARGNPMPRNRSSPSLFPGRSIRFKKKKIGILASIWFEEHTLASRKKKGRRVIIFIAVLERQRCKRASFKSNLRDYHLNYHSFKPLLPRGIVLGLITTIARKKKRKEERSKKGEGHIFFTMGSVVFSKKSRNAGVRSSIDRST